MSFVRRLTNERGVALPVAMSVLFIVAAGLSLVFGALRIVNIAHGEFIALAAFVGLGAYRTAFGRPKATLGAQPEPFEGAAVWVLPSPSGLNANYPMPALVQLFRKLRRNAWRPNSRRRSSAS